MPSGYYCALPVIPLVIVGPFAGDARSPEPQKRRLGTLPIVRGALTQQSRSGAASARCQLSVTGVV